MNSIPATLAEHFSEWSIMDDYSLEIVSNDAESLRSQVERIPQGTRISVPFLGSDSFDDRVKAAALIRALGFVPVPHIAARRLKSQQELSDFLTALKWEAKVEDLFIVAGDLDQPAGPFADALDVIESGALTEAGIRHVGIAGYPEGHPKISDEILMDALLKKHRAVHRQGMSCSIMTQFAFSADPVLNWLRDIRNKGISAPVYIGVPGPANVKTLLRYAKFCGVGASASVLKKYGISITKLMSSAAPVSMIDDLQSQLNPIAHGTTYMHLYPFGGIGKAVRWIDEYRNGNLN